MQYVGMESKVVAQEVGTPAGEQGIKFWIDAIGILADGIFYIIFLPVHRGMGIDALFLMEKAMGGF